MNWRRAFAFLLLAILPLLYFNCSRMKGAKYGAVLISDGSSAGPDGPGGTQEFYYDFQVFSDGTVKVWQDKELKYSPTNGEPGSYSIQGLPGWATFDSSTGTITGTPRKLSDAGRFTITKEGGLKYGEFVVTVVGDELKEQQWHLTNLGQTGFALTPGSSGQDIHFSQTVKKSLFGSGIRVAISDTGAVLSHPDLSPNVLKNESRNYANNFAALKTWIGDPTPPVGNPEEAHGTAVTGLVSEKGWNGIGGRGVAPESKFAAFYFLPAQDKLAQAGLTDAALYDQFAGNFHVFNFSWGDPQCALTEYNQSFTDKLVAGVTIQRNGRGSAYVLAAGNAFIEDLSDCYLNVNPGVDFVLGNASFSELNTTPYTINVAAVNADGVVATYSTPGSAIWISSTGGEYGHSKINVGDPPQLGMPALITTDYPGCNNGMSSLDKADSDFNNGSNNPDCRYVNTMNGTSGATPTVTGAVALILQANPNLYWRDVKHILAKTADKIDANVLAPNHPVSGLNLTGHAYETPWITNKAGFNFHNFYGFGRINVDKAVDLAKIYDFPLGTFKTTGFKYDSGTINVAVPDGSPAGVTQTMAVTDAMAIEAVQLRVSTTDCAGDMGLELTSPMGTKSILMNINSKLRDGAILNHIFLSNAFYGEPSAGTWSFKVIDGRTTCQARLTNWKLNFFGH